MIEWRILSGRYESSEYKMRYIANTLDRISDDSLIYLDEKQFGPLPEKSRYVSEQMNREAFKAKGPSVQKKKKKDRLIEPKYPSPEDCCETG